MVLCGLMAFAADKVSGPLPQYPSPAPQYAAPASLYAPPPAQYADPTPESLHRKPTSETSEIVHSNPQMIEWLLNRATLGDDSERTHSYAALTALTPSAAKQIVKAMEDGDSNPETRIIAMSLMQNGEASIECPRKDVCAALLRISQTDSEDAEIRKFATITLCRIICKMEGQPLPASSGSY